MLRVKDPTCNLVQGDEWEPTVVLVPSVAGSLAAISNVHT